LADEYGSGKPTMNPKRFTATLNDGRAIPEYFGYPPRQASEIDQNQTKTGDGSLTFLLPPERASNKNDQDEI